MVGFPLEFKTPSGVECSHHRACTLETCEDQKDKEERWAKQVERVYPWNRRVYPTKVRRAMKSHGAVHGLTNYLRVI